ncbi:MAG: DNA primase [Rhodothermales bacterium]|nr:DNA primase [Rhodothermales bacterium]MBO6780422.1 DNA primase [Rhodothermales bacterium]
MRISDDTIESVRSSADVVDVVGDYVRLKKRGSNYVGLCPFHNEKTPSFNVNPSLGIFKCFGCGEGGDVFSFISRVENLTFPEAVTLLAERLGIVIEQPDGVDEGASEREAILHALHFAARYFYQQLTREETGAVARDYLAKRQIEPEMVKRFGVGYARDEWDGLLKAATEARISESMLEAAGLVLPRRDGSGYYDRYRHRLIFPILSHVGKVLGFGGRILEKADDQPKYINSPETEVYHKGKVLYGLYHAKNAIRGREEVVLVEGYTDVIALHQAGVEHVVASSGTALTSDQVKLIGRYARRVIMLYDADAAGAKATVRGIDLLLQAGMAPYVVSLPEGEDPDTFVQKFGAEAFETAMSDRREDFVTYLHGRARAKGSLDEPDSRAETHHAIMKLVSRIPDQLMRESYVQRAASVLGVPDVYLRRAMQADRKREARNQQRRQRREPAQEPAAQVPQSAERQPLPEEKTLLRLMLDHGSPMVSFILSRTALDEFTEGPSRRTAHALVQQFESGEIRKQSFLDGTLGTGIQRLAAEILTDREEPSDNWEKKRRITVPQFNENARAAASGAMTLLKLDRLDEMIAGLRHGIHIAEREGREVRPLQEELVGLQQLRRKIEDREFLN